MRAADSAPATRSRTSEITEGPRPPDVLVDAVERVLQRDDPELAGLREQAVVQGQLLLQRQRDAALLPLELLEERCAPEHGVNLARHASSQARSGRWPRV